MKRDTTHGRLGGVLSQRIGGVNWAPGGSRILFIGVFEACFRYELGRHPCPKLSDVRRRRRRVAVRA